MMNYNQIIQWLFNNFWCGEQRRVSTNPPTPAFLLDGTQVTGVDLSHWNVPPVDLKSMVRDYGIRFVIIKMCDGSLNSRYYFEHAAAAKEAGIPWGAYVWLYPDNKVNMDAQVNAWHERAQIDPPPMGIYIDAEATLYGGQPANPNATDLRMAHDKLKAKQSKAAITYTSKGYADAYLKGFDWSREALWAAHYTTAAVPLLPAGAPTWRFWQYTSTFYIGAKKYDMNRYNGTPEQFQAEYGGITPPTGETMKYYNLTGTMNIRAGTSIASADIGDLFVGDKIEVDTVVQVGATDKWGRLAKITRANGTVFALPAFPCYVSLNTTSTVEYFPVVEPATLDITVTDPVTGKRYGANGIKLPELS